MSTLADLLSDPATWTDRTALVAAIVADLGVDDAVARTIAARLAETELTQQRRRQVTEAGDDVVQGLTAAVYALELDDRPRAETYLRQTLYVASELVTELNADRAFLRSAPAHLTTRQAV
ncbi:hypothetical protein [Nocardioides sp.]|uniref:hypothetical protein n=1 Tax=Nocardioides sp. TaxID=35761 RepID=UPI002B273F20|nr:hypothetical protein [Nocardioides sp.]